MLSQNANDYFMKHIQFDKWNSFDELVKEQALTTAENLINGHFTLRSHAEETDAYFHAVCEQALHLLLFSKERFQLQSEGVNEYKVDDIQISMTNALFSPIVKGFLKPIIKKEVGRLV